MSRQYRRSLYAEYAVCLGHQLPGGHHTSSSNNNNKLYKVLRLYFCGYKNKPKPITAFKFT